jgi:hypothetical protein
VIVDGKTLGESTIARTAAMRRRMARDAVAAAVEADPLRRESIERISRLTAAQAGRQAERLVAGVQDAASHVILESLVSQWTVPETARQLQEVIAGNALWQSAMLARTDLIATSNAASLEGAMSLGEEAPGYKIWLATSDERTRDTHAEADGQAVPTDQPFSVGGSLMMYPGDPDGGSDSETINCRCTIIYSDDVVPTADADELGLSASGEEGEMAAALTAAEFSAKERDRLADEGIAMEDGSFPIRNGSDLRNAIMSVGRASDPDAARRHIIKRARALDLLDELPEAWNISAAAASEKAQELSRNHPGHPGAKGNTVVPQSIPKVIPEHNGKDEYRDLRQEARKRMVDSALQVVAAALQEGYEEEMCADCGQYPAMKGSTACEGCLEMEGTVASVEPDCGCGDAVLMASVAAPETPPASWFEDPQLDGPTPLTVDEDGRMRGHLALWDQCHTGYPDRCVTPPRGLTYDWYQAFPLDTAEGQTIRVGKVTVGTGHANPNASRAAAAAHYDNTGSVAAYARAGEDRFGPWLAGAVKSDATPEQIRDLRVNGPSGDWRLVRSPQKSALELVGVLSVPVQGFPIAALSAAGDGEQEVVSLIAGLAYSGVQAATVTFEEALESLNMEAEVEGELPVLFAPHIDREIGQRIAFLSDKGTWPTEPISGGTFSPYEWDQVVRASTRLIVEPETPESILLRRRLLDTGFLVT